MRNVSCRRRSVMLERKDRAWEREMAVLVAEKEELAVELKHQKEVDSVSQEQLDTMYAEWGITSDDNQKLAKEKYWLITEGLGAFLTARLSKLDKEFGRKTPALLEKILELPLMSIDELKALLTPAGPSSLKSLSGDDSQ
ncbi:hypothetical protein Hanom_Chr04g00364141 [Helianthus anomalus]